MINASRGFVLLSVDSLYCPILAYDSAGNFSCENEYLNPGLLNWLNKHAHELDFVRNTQSKLIDSVGRLNKTLWRALGGALAKSHAKPTLTGVSLRETPNGVGLDVPPPTLISSDPIEYSTNSTIGPLCQTFWGQDYPFNSQCPLGGSLSGYVGYVPAGCVPVAMAQIMYFWKYPLIYDYANMPLTKLASGSMSLGSGGLYETARLIHEIGLFLPTSYGTTESSSNVDDIVPAFTQFFYYSSAQSTPGLSDQAWSGEIGGVQYADFLTSEIQNNQRPCIVSGFPGQTSVFGWGIFPSPTGTGHAWVCDGSNVTTFYFGHVDTYQDYWGSTFTQTTYDSYTNYSLLHMNWGWDSPYGAIQNDENSTPLTNNGWYVCTVNYTQASGNSEDFQFFQQIIYNIHP